MSYSYDVAIVYSTEDKPIARQITESLRKRGISVFFDEFAEAELWGQDLYKYLTGVYEESRIGIIIISESYLDGRFGAYEFRNLLAHSQTRDSFVIIPLTVGDVPSHFFRNIDHFAWSSMGAEEVSILVEQRLKTLPPPSKAREPENYHVIRRETGWSVKREGASRATSVHENQKDAIAAARKLAKKHRPSKLVIHRKDGTIESSEVIRSEEGNADPDS